jgi:hypothetical protein
MLKGERVIFGTKVDINSLLWAFSFELYYGFAPNSWHITDTIQMEV